MNDGDLHNAQDLSDLPEWNLGDLYSGMACPEYLKDLARVQTMAEQFEAGAKGKLAQMLDREPDQLGAAIVDYEAIGELMGKLMTYAGLNYAGKTTDPERAKFLGDTQEAMTRASSHLLFFPLELNRLDDDALAQAMAASDALGRYRPWLEDLRKEKPFQLEDRVEQLFHDKAVTGRVAWNRLFDETMAELSFEIGGETLSLEPALNRLQDHDRNRRREAAHAIGDVLKGHGRLFTLITNTLAKDKRIADEWRGFEDVADSRHLDNRVERDVVDALAQAVAESFPRLSHRYYQMKAGWLGLDRLSHWDRNAPLPETPDKLFGWAEAKQTVLSAYSDFSPEMAKHAGAFFEGNWIDAPVRPGKQAGAFAHPAVPSVHPYVLLNYQGKPRDVMTLAHELGHGVHQVLAAGQGALMAQTPLTLAETASVFGEMLTFRSMLDKAQSDHDRKAMLSQKVEDMINTVVRQIAFYMFERKVHEARAQGELTETQICDFWMAVQRESLGPAFELDDSYRHYWCYVPHFVHAPFYVYAYAFGDCLVNSLYAVYCDGETGFQERYLDMLRAGGTKHHSELLAPFGLDATDPGFWQKGLSVIETMIDEIGELE